MPRNANIKIITAGGHGSQQNAPAVRRESTDETAKWAAEEATMLGSCGASTLLCSALLGAPPPFSRQEQEPSPSCSRPYAHTMNAEAEQGGTCNDQSNSVRCIPNRLWRVRHFACDVESRVGTILWVPLVKGEKKKGVPTPGDEGDAYHTSRYVEYSPRLADRGTIAESTSM